MDGYNFTERFRRVLAMAREEAARLHHEYVDTEHLLLGLIREREGVAAAVLRNLSVEFDKIQQKIEETVKKGEATSTTGPPHNIGTSRGTIWEITQSPNRSIPERSLDFAQQRRLAAYQGHRNGTSNASSRIKCASCETRSRLVEKREFTTPHSH